MIRKFFSKENKSFFIGLFIVNVILIFSAEFFIIHPPEFIKQIKNHKTEKPHEKRR